MKQNDYKHYRSNDIIRNLFAKKSFDKKSKQPTISTDKTKKMLFYKPEISFLRKIQTGSEFTLNDKSQEPPKSVYLDMLMKHLDSSEEAKTLSKYIRNEFKEKSIPLANLNIEMGESVINKQDEISDKTNELSNSNEPAQKSQRFNKNEPKKKESGLLNLTSKFKTTSEFYQIQCKIGNGCFGEVYLAIHVLTGCFVALKIIPKITYKKTDSKRKIDNEVAILQKLSSTPYVIKLYEVFEDQFSVFLVFEYAENGDLVKFFHAKQLFSERRLKLFVHKIFIGMEKLHALNIIHRDLKLDNILLDKNLNPKICDFGISNQIEKNAKIYDTGGTPAYLAPEVILSDGRISTKTDIWSLGVLLFLLSFGRVPFGADDIQTLYTRILSGKFKIEEKDECSPELYDLISKMLEVNVDARITMSEILRHCWFNGVTKDKSPSGSQFLSKKLTVKKSVTDYLIEVGFSESYVKECFKSEQGNYVKTCYELMYSKHCA